MVPRPIICCGLIAIGMTSACAPNAGSGSGSTTISSATQTTAVEPAPSTAAPASSSTSTIADTAPVASLDYVDEEKSVLAIIESRDDTTRFAELAAALGSDDVFRQARGVTLLVPIDSAFESMSDEDFAALLADPTAIALLVSEHLSIGTASRDELVERRAMVNAMARTLPVDDDGGIVSIGGAELVVADLVADNGVVHLIDSIIRP